MGGAGASVFSPAPAKKSGSGSTTLRSALAVLHQDDLKKSIKPHQYDTKKRMTSSYSSNRLGAKLLARQEIEFLLQPKQH